MKVTHRTLRVRRCGADDVPILATLRRVWTEEQAGSAADDDSFEAEFAAWHARENDHRVTWLAEVEVGRVGMLNVLIFTRMPRPRCVGAATMPTQWGYIANMFVLERYRNSGIGAALLSAATDFADQTGLARLVLSPSQRSVPFYERAGFVVPTSLMMREPFSGAAEAGPASGSGPGR